MERIVNQKHNTTLKYGWIVFIALKHRWIDFTVKNQIN
jgi:hypothetical protein